VSAAESYADALAAFLREAAEGWARAPGLADAARRACSLADAEVATGKHLLPAPGDVFAAFRLTPLTKVRVVILGQDPYPTPGNAHGLAFSVRPGVKPPASLRNILAELREDLRLDPPAGGDLTAWARDGVLLLNTALTVEASRAGAHMRWPWSEVTRAAIAAVSRERPRAAFVLWGRKAQAHAALVDVARHLVVASEHPSPLSASRGFLGSKPFSRIDTWLAANGEAPIRWGRPAQSRLE
jgi:uracil-DNA glycosylase